MVHTCISFSFEIESLIAHPHYTDWICVGKRMIFSIAFQLMIVQQERLYRVEPYSTEIRYCFSICSWDSMDWDVEEPYPECYTNRPISISHESQEWFLKILSCGVIIPVAHWIWSCAYKKSRFLKKNQNAIFWKKCTRHTLQKWSLWYIWSI